MQKLKYWRENKSPVEENDPKSGMKYFKKSARKTEDKGSRQELKYSLRQIAWQSLCYCLGRHVFLVLSTFFTYIQNGTKAPSLS